MEILVSGDTKWLKKDFWEVLAEQNQVIVCTPDAESIKVNQVSAYPFEIGQTEFDQMFQTFHFDCMIFFSWCFEQDAFGEIKCLDRILTMCGQKQKMRIIYVHPSGQISARYGLTHAVIEEACDKMCSRFCMEGGSLLKLSVPYLVSAVQDNGIFQAHYESIRKEKKLMIPYQKNYIVDFLFGNDLAAFFNVFLDGNESGYRNYKLWGGNEMTVSEMAEMIEKSAGIRSGDVARTFGNIDRDKREADDRQVLRHKYGWFPKEKLENRIGDWYTDEQGNRKPERKKLLKCLRWEENATAREQLLQVTEIAALFAVCEILTVKTRYMMLVDFADFRLFFVAVTGMMYGLRYGMIAAIASCIAYLVRLGGGINWQIQFYNIINWLPFATYLLTGAIAGYTKDRYQDMIHHLRKSQEIMENKYIYLNELYTKVLEKKEDYGSQIAGYRDSYARIYAVTKQLNSMHPDEIICQAVTVLENMMDTQSVAVYVLDGNSSARLGACSRALTDTLNQSILLTDMPECRRALESSETWVNRAFLAGQPDYAYGVWHEKVLIGMITIQKAHYAQMNMEYFNRFQIVAGLIADTWSRAVDYQKACTGRECPEDAGMPVEIVSDID